MKAEAEGNPDPSWKLSEPLSFGVALTKVQLSPLSLKLVYEYPPLTYRDGSFYNADGQLFLSRRHVAEHRD